MMKLIENACTEPQRNLALEEYLCRLVRREGGGFLMLWRNAPSVIIGRFQDAAAEVNAAFLRERGIPVLRRNSGGGAVYHDLGNVNYSFITSDSPGRCFVPFAEKILKALASMGVKAEFSGKNDITVRGRKVSGMAQWRHGGTLLCHGTLLFDCSLESLSSALRVPDEKLARHGVPSVRGRVANLKPLLPGILDGADFMSRLQASLQEQTGAGRGALSGRDEEEIQGLMREKYMSREWNYGGGLDAL